MSVVWMCNGNGTSTTMAVSTKVTGGPVRFARSSSPDFSSPTYSGSVSVNANNQVKGGWSGLTPNTRYWWRVEDNGVLDTSVTGTFVTDPAAVGDPASFTVACIGDAGTTPRVPGVAGSAPNRLSNHPVFDTIRQRSLTERWLATYHLGDICYYDLGSGNHGLSSTASVAQYRSMWDDIFLQPRQHQLYRSAQFAYMWDDHDFGPNDSDSSAPGRNNALQVYREILATPTLPLSGSNPVYHSWQIGRVLFILSDTRSARAGSSMLGAAQMSWLETLLSTSTAEALVWLMPTPWLGLGSDTWAGYTSQRSTIIEMLADGSSGRSWLPRMVMMNMDAHCLAAASALGNPHGGFPVMVGAGLDATHHNYTAQYDLGMWPGRNQYATIQVADRGDDVSLTMTGWRGHTPIVRVAANSGSPKRIETAEALPVLR